MSGRTKGKTRFSHSLNFLCHHVVFTTLQLSDSFLWTWNQTGGRSVQGHKLSEHHYKTSLDKSGITVPACGLPHNPPSEQPSCYRAVSSRYGRSGIVYTLAFFPQKTRNTWIMLGHFWVSTAGFYASPLLRSWQSGKILTLSQENKSLSFWTWTFLYVLAKEWSGEGEVEIIPYGV